jgi:hypothetical protein
MFSFGFLNELPPDIGRITFTAVTKENGEKKITEIPHHACEDSEQFQERLRVKKMRCLDHSNE